MVTIVDNMCCTFGSYWANNLKSSHHKEKDCNYVWWWMLSKTYRGDHFPVYTYIEPLYCMPEMNIYIHLYLSKKVILADVLS